MLSRRHFLDSALHALLALPVLRWPADSSQRHAKVLRLLAVIDPAHEELRRGYEFGVAEGAHSAMLFGWKVESLDDAREVNLDLEPHAIVLGAGGAVPAWTTRLPVLRVACDAGDHAGVYTLAPCDTAQIAWLPSLSRYGAEQLNDRYRSATGTPMTSDGWLGWFAVKILVESAMRAGGIAPDAIRARLDAARFDGHKGQPLYFDARRRLVQPLYRRE